MASEAVMEIEQYTEKGDQLVDLVHSQVKDNTCLRISDERFSLDRRNTPAYSKLLAISNVYGYVIAGTPKGLSVFMAKDAREELAKGKSTGTNTAVMMSARKEVDLRPHGRITHVGISADELSVLVVTVSGRILVFAAASLVSQGSSTPTKTIEVGQEIRDLRPNPKDLPTAAAVVTVAGDLKIVDTASGAVNTIVPSSTSRVLAVCWSPKGKQLVCGDATGTLTQRTPSDGTIKRTVKPQTADGNIPEGAAVLAVYWISQHTYFAVYGLLPDGAFTPGCGGGGPATEDEEFEDNATAAYVISRADKTAPLEWIYIEDPCSAMVCPGRYPGFHFGNVGDWGASAKNVLIMAGSGSDATLTIGEAATETEGANDDPTALDWAQWDIDGSMAVMPLSAIADDDDDSSDTFPVGVAVDFTGHQELPPVTDDGARVPPVPILWILNTDACLLAYHICNLFEMPRGGRSSGMIEAVKPLPGAPSASSVSQPAAFASGSAFGSGFGAAKAATPQTGGFGTASSLTSSFGSSGFGQSKITPIVKAPASGFGSGTKFGSGTSFGGFAGAAAAAATTTGASTSVFDAPSQGASIFDAPAKGPSIFGSAAKTTTPFGAPAKEEPKKASPPKSVSFGGSSVFGGAKPAFGSAKPAGDSAASLTSGFGGFGSFGSTKTAGSTTSEATPTTKPAAVEQPSSLTSKFGGFGSFGGAKPATTAEATPTTKPAVATSGFGGFGSFGGTKPAAPTEAAAAAAKPATATSGFGGFGGFGTPGGAKPSTTAEATPPAKPAVDSAASLASGFGGLGSLGSSWGSAKPAEPKAAVEPQPEQEKEKAEAEKRREQQELERKTQQLIDQQYIATCNEFDADLKAFARAVQMTDSAVSRMRAARLPPISVDATVQEMAALTSRMQTMGIDDTDLWNRTADVLLEALHVSRDELRTSQRTLSRQMSAYVKTETKREEIARIIGVSATASTSGGLNPLQRDYQRRLKSAYNLIAKRASDVSQVVDAEADRLEGERDAAPRALRAPTVDSIQRTLHNVGQTLGQKNRELDELAALVDMIELGDRQQPLPKRSRPSPLHAQPQPQARAPRSAPGSHLRTAAGGVPWSPGNLPLSTPSPRTNRGYGLRAEDLLVSGRAMPTMHAAEPELSPLQPRAGDSPNARFPHTQVRELVPRAHRPPRRTSLVVEDDACDDTSTAAPSAFSAAAVHLRTRRQRAVVCEVLTRPNRVAAVIRSPESAVARARQLGRGERIAAAEPVPMPNLDRYVQAFGKLKIEEPEPAAVPEPEPAAKAEPTAKATPATAPQWECSVCMIANPDSATQCLACEAAKPGTEASDISASKPPTEFKLSGATFGAALSAALPKSTSSLSFGGFSGKAATSSFSSFAPPAAAAALSSIFAAAPAAAPVATSSGEQWTCDVCELKSPATAAKCQVCDAPRPGTPATSAATLPSKPAAPSFLLSGGKSLSSLAPSTTQTPSFSLSAAKSTSFSSFVPPAGSLFGAKPPDSKPAVDAPEWICHVCELRNPGSARKCTVCDEPKSDAAKVAGPAPSFGQPPLQSAPAAANSEDASESDAETEATESVAGSSEPEDAEESDEASADEEGAEESEQADASAGEHAGASSQPGLPDTFANTLKKAITEDAHENSDEPEAEAESVATSIAGDEQSDHSAPSEKAETGGHDSDDFVHVSQQISGLDDIVPIEEAESPKIDAESTDKEPSVSRDAEPSPEPTPPQFDVNELQSLFVGASVDHVVDQALATGLSAADSLRENDATLPAPTPPAEVSASAQRSPAGSSASDFVILTHSDTSARAETSEPEDEPSDGEPKSTAAPGFNMDSISAGIDSALLTTEPAVDRTPSKSPDSSKLVSDDDDAASDSDLGSEVSEESVDATQQSPSPPNTGASSTSSFFKAGKLGSFGSFGQKSSFSSGNGAFGAASLQSSTGGLPNAFATPTQSSVPAFGGKLDKPVFGVASMSGFGAKPAGAPSSGTAFGGVGFGSKSGFGAHANTQSAFAAASKSESSSIFSKGDAPAFGQAVAGNSGFGRAFGSPKKTPTPNTSKSAAADPIRRVIQGDDSDAQDSASDSD